MHEFKTESKKILDIVINSIYSTKEVFLRELISNASDSIDKVMIMRSQAADYADGESQLVEDGWEPAIELAFDVDAGTITVSDNGIGMNDVALERELGTIAHSSSQEAKLAEMTDGEGDADIIGQFGVGFYSSSWWPIT